MLLCSYICGHFSTEWLFSHLVWMICWTHSLPPLFNEHSGFVHVRPQNCEYLLFVMFVKGLFGFCHGLHTPDCISLQWQHFSTDQFVSRFVVYDTNPLVPRSSSVWLDRGYMWFCLDGLQFGLVFSLDLVWVVREAQPGWPYLYKAFWMFFRSLGLALCLLFSAQQCKVQILNYKFKRERKCKLHSLWMPVCYYASPTLRNRCFHPLSWCDLMSGLYLKLFLPCTCMYMHFCIFNIWAAKCVAVNKSKYLVSF